MQLNSVVLPAPFGPISPQISPVLIWQVTLSSARTPPKCTETIIDAQQRFAFSAHALSSRAPRVHASVCLVSTLFLYARALSSMKERHGASLRGWRVPLPLPQAAALRPRRPAKWAKSHGACNECPGSPWRQFPCASGGRFAEQRESFSADATFMQKWESDHGARALSEVGRPAGERTAHL